MNSHDPPVLMAFLSEDWDSPPAGFTRRPMLLAVHRKLAAEGWETLAVERPICPLTSPVREPGKVARAILRGLRPTADHLYLATPVAAVHERLARRSAPLERLNGRLMQQQTAAWLTRLGVSRRPRVVWLFHPCQRWLLNAVGHDALIYECYDEYAGMIEDESHRLWLQQAESLILERADLALTTAVKLYRSRRLQNPNTVMVNNGVDYDLFASGSGLPEPADIARIPHPRIGFAGVINRRLDTGLLGWLAATHPAWSLVMLGPASDIRRDDLSPLRRLPNVHFLGMRPQSLVPAYLVRCDVNIIPYVRNEATAGVYPLKLNEYLAVGRPVVTTDFSPDLADFGGLVRTASTEAEFALAVRAALVEDAEAYAARARARAREASWDRRADEIAAHILRTTSKAEGRASLCVPEFALS